MVLNKIDLAPNPEEILESLSEIAVSVEIVPVSAVTGAGMEQLEGKFAAAVTGVFLGSSGVGKSTLVNRLLGKAVQETWPVRGDDDKGRHTTTRRQLFLLPIGGCVIDTPGIREFQLWQGGEAFFQEIEALSFRCRFRDCKHETEPGCAVLLAVGRGELELRRLQSYRKLKRENRFIAAKKDERIRYEEKQRAKQLMKSYRRINRGRKRF